MAPRFSSNDPEVNLTTVRAIEMAVKAMLGDASPPIHSLNGDDALIGPWGPLACTPSIVADFFSVGKDAYDPSFLKPRNRQLALLGLCSVMDVPYVRAVHKAVAHGMGITEQQWADAMAQKVPCDLQNEGETVAYKVGRYLTDSRGVMDQDLWEEAVRVLGKKEFLGVVHIVGIYKYVATLAQVNGP